MKQICRRAFEALPSEGTRHVRHRQSGWVCIFQPNSEVSLANFENPRSGANEDVQCAESSLHWVNTQRVSRFPGAPIDDVFVGAETLGRRQMDVVLQELRAPQLHPDQPSDGLMPSTSMPFRELALVGEDMSMPVVVYVAMVQLPGDWFLMTRYHAFLQTSNRREAQRIGREQAQAASRAFIQTATEWAPPSPP
jgi:hypothetical protein